MWDTHITHIHRFYEGKSKVSNWHPCHSLKWDRPSTREARSLSAQPCRLAPLCCIHISQLFPSEPALLVLRLTLCLLVVVLKPKGLCLVSQALPSCGGNRHLLLGCSMNFQTSNSKTLVSVGLARPVLPPSWSLVMVFSFRFVKDEVYNYIFCALYPVFLCPLKICAQSMSH